MRSFQKYVTSLVSPTGLKKIHATWNMSWAVFLVFFVELGVVFIGEDF